MTSSPDSRRNLARSGSRCAAVAVLAVLTATVSGCATSQLAIARPEAFPRAGSTAPGVPATSASSTSSTSSTTSPTLPESTVVATPLAPLAPTNIVAAVLATAREQTGVRYVLGGATPDDGFDCSGLVRYVLALHGINVPRTTAEQFDRGPEIDRPQTSPGDLVFFSTTGPGPTHVGIVIDERQFIHAPGTGAVVRIERFDSPYWTSRFLGTRRPLAAR